MGSGLFGIIRMLVSSLPFRVYSCLVDTKMLDPSVALYCFIVESVAPKDLHLQFCVVFVWICVFELYRVRRDKLDRVPVPSPSTACSAEQPEAST